MMINYKTMLVVAAHPDDEVLGCGGTMARLVREGCRVVVAILGEGITSRHARREEADTADLAALRACSQRAAAAMGVEDVRLFDFPDNRFDTVPLLDVIKCVEALVEDVQPEVVLTHHSGDLNIDHVITHRAVLTATRPTDACCVREVYAFEVPSSTDWAFGVGEDAFHPNTFADITDTLDAKIKAMACYESEARVFPHPRSPEALRATAVRWGCIAGRSAVEAMQCVRHIW